MSLKARGMDIDSSDPSSLAHNYQIADFQVGIPLRRIILFSTMTIHPVFSSPMPPILTYPEWLHDSFRGSAQVGYRLRLASGLLSGPLETGFVYTGIEKSL